MIILSSTTDKLQLTTGQNVTVDVHCSYADHTTSSDNIVCGRQNTAISTATTTDILAAPASGDIRNLKTLNIRNKHATDSVTVTVIYDANGTDYELHKVTLAAGEALEYIEGVGFFVLGAVSPSMGKTLTSDFATSSATAAEVTGLTLALPVGVFTFNYWLLIQTSATATAWKCSVNHDGTVTSFVYNVAAAQANPLQADGILDQDISLTTGGLLAVNAARAKSTAGLTAFVSCDTANADMLGLVSGLMVVTVAGNLELWYASEGAVATTLKAGSSLVVNKCG